MQFENGTEAVYAKKPRKKRQMRSDEETDEQNGSDSLPKIRVLSQRTIATEYHVTVGDIENDEDQGLCDLLGLLRNASEYDIIKIYINSGGGSVFTAMRLLNALKSCEATLITVGDSWVASAATFILLQGDIIEVNDHCNMLIHDISTELSGKFSDISNTHSNNERMKDKLFRDVYEGFLSEEEISLLKKGVDFRFDRDEIVQRIERMKRFKTQKAEKKMKEEIEKVSPPAGPKRKKSRKS